MKQLIERNRTKEEMVQCFWDDMHDRSWLYFNLQLERMIELEAEQPDEEYYKQVTGILRWLAMNDYASMKRAIIKLADYLGVELTTHDIII